MRARRRRRRNSVNATKAIIIAVAIGLAVYLVTATALGNFVSQKLIAPVLAKMGGEPTPSVDIGPLTPESTPDAANAPGDIRLESYTLYALQTGAFSSQQNADNEAQQLKARGGAGYVLKDTHFRVFAAVFKTEADAKTVKEQLAQQSNMETALYKINIPEVAIKVIASNDQTQAVIESFNCFNNAISSIMSVGTELDKKQIDEAAAKTKLKNVANTFEIPMQRLATGGDTGSLVSGYLKNGKALIDEIADDAIIGIDFSAKLKYNNMCVIYEYIDMLQIITSA